MAQQRDVVGDAALDGKRIFHALNYTRNLAHMTLATSSAKGGEALAIDWAAQKSVETAPA